MVSVLEDNWFTNPKKDRAEVCAAGRCRELRYGICDGLVNLVALFGQYKPSKGNTLLCVSPLLPIEGDSPVRTAL